MTRLGQIIAILAILGGTALLIGLFFLLAPKAETETREKILLSVEVMTATPDDHQVTIPSQGILYATTTSTLASEVSGIIIETHSRFKVGGLFDEGDVILHIDSADYETALEAALAEAARARLDLALEEGRKRQALKDWERLGGNEAPTSLVLREPQLASAEAAVAAADAAAEKARRDLKRTQLKAPYPCRIARKHTDFGSFVSVGSPLADIEHAELLEVRLPISVDDSVFFGPDSKAKGKVSLEAEFNNKTRTWPASIVRDEGAVDRSSRSIYLVASISRENDNPHLQPGLFVRAKIEGDALNDVFIIPRRAFLDANRILVVEETTTDGKKEDQLQFREVDVLHTLADDVIVNGGLKTGDRICLTPIDNPIASTPVRIEERGKTGEKPEGKVEVEADARQS